MCVVYYNTNTTVANIYNVRPWVKASEKNLIFNLVIKITDAMPLFGRQELQALKSAAENCFPDIITVCLSNFPQLWRTELFISSDHSDTVRMDHKWPQLPKILSSLAILMSGKQFRRIVSWVLLFETPIPICSSSLMRHRDCRTKRTGSERFPS